MPSRDLARALAATLCTAILPLPGCWTHAPASSPLGDPPDCADAAITSPEPRWIPRDLEPVRELQAATPEFIRPVHLAQDDPTDQPPTLPSDASPPEVHAAIRSWSERILAPSKAIASYWSYHVTHNAISGPGLLRLWTINPDAPPNGPLGLSVSRPVNTSDEDFRSRYGFVPNASYITSRTLELLQPTAPLRGLDRRFKDQDLQQYGNLLRAGDLVDELAIHSGIALRIPEPGDIGQRGLIIHLHSIQPNPWERATADHFRRQGWTVLDVSTAIAVRAPVSETDRLEADRLIAEFVDGMIRRAAREAISPRRRWQTERLPQEADRKLRGSFQLCPGDDPRPIAEQIATEIDTSIAGNVYAVQAALDYVRDHRPDIPTRPLVIAGFSGGALGAPALAWRLRDQVDALVLIAGGADIFRISQSSAITDGSIRLRCGERRVPRAAIDALAPLVLQQATLDPYHIAPRLGTLPVLQLHATLDTFVPASSGRLLTRRLPSPERLDLLGGHRLMFLLLPSRATFITDWLDRTLPAP